MSFDIKETLLIILAIGVPIGIIVAANCIGTFAEDSAAVKALEVQGFSDASVVEKDYLFVPFKGGDKTDNVKFTMLAINPAGKKVTVCVYAGWPFKGETIRSC